MLQITVVVHLTGLLLMVPDSVAQGTLDHGRLPMHVLMPATGIDAPAHVPQLGWKSDADKCSEPDIFWRGHCWANLDGMSVEIGRGGLPAANAEIRPGGSVVVAGGSQARSVSRDVFDRLFSDRPGRRLRARVSLFAGQVTDSCANGVWKFGTREDTVTSVLTWAFQIDSQRIQTLTLTEFRDDAADTVRHRTIQLPRPVHGTLDLLVTYMPLSELEMQPGDTEKQPDEGVTRATHLNALYDILGLSARPEDIPVFGGHYGGGCGMGPFFIFNPSSPTCMTGFAFPPPR